MKKKSVSRYSELLKYANDLKVESENLMLSVNFTVAMIDKLEDKEENHPQMLLLMKRLNIDYNILLTLEKRYESIRLELNKISGKEILLKLTNLEPLDFNVDY